MVVEICIHVEIYVPTICDVCILLYLNTSVTSIHELSTRNPYDISLVKIELHSVITQCIQDTGDVMLISSIVNFSIHVGYT